MVAQIVNYDDPMTADIVLIGAGYGRTASYGKGTEKAPEAIVECLNTQVELYDRITGTSPGEYFRIAFDDIAGLATCTPYEMVGLVEAVVAPFCMKRADSPELPFPILIGGEHSVTNGSLRALSRLQNPAETTIVSVDAHLDLRDTDADFNDAPHGLFSHACVMRRAFDLGFPMVCVGARAYSVEEETFLAEHGGERLRVFEWGISQWGKKGIPLIEEITGVITTQSVYLTIDADGIDPSHMPDVGTPVQGGLEWWYFHTLVRTLFTEKQVLGVDLVEVIPESRVTVFGAASIVNFIMACRFEAPFV